MRVLVDIEQRDGELLVIVTAPVGDPVERPVAWAGSGKRLLAAKGSVDAVPAPEELADAIDQGRASDEQLARYGRLLFDAAFGADLWQELLAAQIAAGEPYLELVIRGLATPDQVAMQALRWEALHDGIGAVAAQGAACMAGGAALSVPVGIVRLVPSSKAAGFQPIGGIPRVLFAIGSRLTDPRVRPGAEFMGIMRHLERDGGSIHPRVLQEATRSTLVHALATFTPDVVHFIGHCRRFPDGSVKLQLHPEPGMGQGAEYLSAGELLSVFAEASHTPTMALLSACQTASGAAAPGGASADDGEGPVNALPFAARLVAGGVPVVVAMAGDISDTASRVFTRALTTAIGAGATLGKALVTGRRAAFYGGARSSSADWVRPALFLAEHVSGATPLVRTAAQDAARRRVQQLGVAVTDSVFCGRAAFITALDRLLDGGDPLNVLLAYAPDPSQHYGGKRLLRELAARAIRSGVLPVLLGPYDKEPPRSRLELAQAICDRIDDIRDRLGLGERDSSALAFAEADAQSAPGVGNLARRRKLARAIREDLDALVADLPGDDPVRARADGQPRVILLCHRADKWLDALDDLLGGLLDSPGLNGRGLPVPVVMTGADVDPLKEARLRTWNGLAWMLPEPLDRFTTDDEEDILAYLWWLLNPPRKEHVYAVSRTALPGWSGLLRLFLQAAPLYPGDNLFVVAKTMSDYFTPGDDDELLASYARVLQ